MSLNVFQVMYSLRLFALRKSATDVDILNRLLFLKQGHLFAALNQLDKVVPLKPLDAAFTPCLVPGANVLVAAHLDYALQTNSEIPRSVQYEERSYLYDFAPYIGPHKRQAWLRLPKLEEPLVSDVAKDTLVLYRKHARFHANRLRLKGLGTKFLVSLVAFTGLGWCFCRQKK